MINCDTRWQMMISGCSLCQVQVNPGCGITLNKMSSHVVIMTWPDASQTFPLLRSEFKSLVLTVINMYQENSLIVYFFL